MIYHVVNTIIYQTVWFYMGKILYMMLLLNFSMSQLELANISVYTHIYGWRHFGYVRETTLKLSITCN